MVLERGLRGGWIVGALLWLVAVSVLAAAPTPARGQKDPARMSDDEFVQALGRLPPEEPVDTKRLARLFFSQAATLEGGRTSVQLLEEKVVVPEAAREPVRLRLRQRYEAYERALTGFKQSASDLLDHPDSHQRLYRTLADGLRTCWQLDLHAALVGGYGASASALPSILSSREACGRFRSAAFEPRVERIVADALQEEVHLREEIRDLTEQVQELERLMEDLREIDARD